MKQLGPKIVKAIYDHLGDELSRRIFTDRLMYSLTADGTFLQDCVLTNEAGEKFFSILQGRKNRELCVYGAGAAGRAFYESYSNLIDFFVDRICGQVRMGNIPVLPPDALQDHTSAFVVITLGPGWEEEIQVVFDKLCAWGFSKEQICALHQFHPYLLEHIYFDLPQLKWSDSSVLLDVGAFDGANSMQYLKRYKALFPAGTPEVIAIEPNPTLADQTAKVLNREHGVSFRIIREGVWDKTGIVRADITPSGMFVENQNGAIEMDCITIDDILQGKPVDLIKMDIEGAEYKAIKGASNTIRACKPQLAISIYHKTEDIVELPRLIMELDPGYTFYLRHYSVKADDTVLYAIPAE